MARIELTEEKFWELIEDSSRKGRTVVHENFEVSKSWTGTFNGLNTSSLYSFLIKEAGRLCDGYASDMFIDLTTVNNAIGTEDTILTEQDSYRYAFGIRDYGVDHPRFLQSRMEEMSVIRNYRKIYYLKVELDETKNYGRYFNLDLYEVWAGSLEYDLKNLTYPWNTIAGRA